MTLTNRFLIGITTAAVLTALVAVAQPAGAVRSSAQHQLYSAAATRAVRAQQSGAWTQRRLLITPERLGAVTAGMTLRQARSASGLNLQTAGDGQYSSPKAPGLIFQLGYTGGSCVSATSPSHVYTAAGVTFGNTLRHLRAVYGSRLHFHTGPAGFSDPTSYFVRGRDRNILFFHLSHQRRGQVVRMASGRTLGSAYC